MRRILTATAAIAAAVVFFLLVTLPGAPRPVRGAADAESARRTLKGAFHVHTTRSDGRGTRESIAAAAARARLQFVIFADHGDGTSAPEPAAWIDGVLCIDAVEISTNGGHYVALDLPQAPYPLGGEPAAVVEDVRRLGGFGIAAHPDSPKPALAWTNGSLQIDGIEWTNLDSEWRDESRPRLFRTVFDYVLRPGPALASLLDAPAALLGKWDALGEGRSIVAVAGVDAHGGITGRAEEGGRWGWAPAVPSYEAVFRTLSLHVSLDEPTTGVAESDARRLLNAIRAGRVYTVVDGIAEPGWVDFRGADGRDVLMGQRAPISGPVTLTVRGGLPDGGSFVLLRNGVEVARSDGPLDFTVDRPGVYRVEGRVAGAPGTPPVPWVVTNPIYLTATASDVGPIEPPETIAQTVAVPGARGWVVEKESGSEAAVAVAGSSMTLKYRLRPGERVSQYAAAATALTPPIPPFDAIVFTGRAARPMRVSVQLRLPDGRRWGRSVYLASDARRVVLPIADLLPADRLGGAPDFTSATSLLFVVDLTNSLPGTAGEFAITDLMFVRR